MIKYVLFDLDGTLTESGPGIIAGVKYALHALGIEEDDEASLMRFIGPPLVDSFQEFHGVGKEDATRGLHAYRAYYDVKGVYENAPYPGVKEMLDELRKTQVSLAIASSKPKNMVDVVLDHFQLAPYFDFAVCGEDHGPLFTKAGVIAEALRRFAERDALTVEEVTAHAVMVGDRKHDIEGAKQNALTAIGVRWGYAPRGELEEAGADHIAEDTAALTAFLIYGTIGV